MARILIAGCGYVGSALGERLLADSHEVFGLRRFKPEERRDEAPAEAGSLGDYLSGMFIDQLRRWSVFSVDKLTRAEAFLRVVAG